MVSEGTPSIIFALFEYVTNEPAKIAEEPSVSVISEEINPPVQLSIVVIEMFLSISFFVKKIYSERIFSLSTMIFLTLYFFN